MQKFSCKSVSELGDIARKLLETHSEATIFALKGKMGAGKTTFIKAICSQLGVSDLVSSPTFSIVNEYYSEEGQVIYHFDMYRLEKLDELYDIGYEDYFYSGNYCFIEWPEKMEELLPENFVYILIEVSDDENIRQITF